MISEEEVFHGGVSRGKVTEIYGPSGVGKTALGYTSKQRDMLKKLTVYSMQLAACALHAGERVIWVGQCSQQYSHCSFFNTHQSCHSLDILAVFLIYR